MPTYPIVRPDGTRARLTAPQWQTLRDIVQRLEARPLLDTWLPHDLFPRETWGERGNHLNQIRRTCTALAKEHVLEIRPHGYHLPVRIRAQVVAAAEAEQSAR